MKPRLLTTLFLLLMALVCYSQSGQKWEKWQWLLGNWKGEGTGKPGQGGGTFSFSFDLDQNIILRKSHSEYSSESKASGIVHDDLMIIYPAIGGKSEKAIYFDNEGHIIEYNVSYNNGSVILTSEKIENSPVFRLTYSPAGENSVDTKFEMSQDGVKFSTYIEGRSSK